MIDVAILEPLLISKNKSKKEKSITTCITTPVTYLQKCNNSLATPSPTLPSPTPLTHILKEITKKGMHYKKR